MSTLSACALFRRCLADERCEDEWHVFVERFGWQVRNVARLGALRLGLTLEESDLEEIVQELYCRLLAPRGLRFHGRTDSELWSFLGSVCRNLTVDRMRSFATQKRLSWEKQLPLENRSPATARLRSPILDPEERLLGRERRRRFFEHCLEIARCDRVMLELRVLRLAVLEGWTSREIARHLHHRLSAGQVDLLVHRLRRHLAKDGIALPRRCGLASAAPGASAVGMV